MSEYVGIKAGAPHEHTELSEYYCARCGYPVTDHDSYCRECGGAFQRSLATEPCDRDALLDIADEMERRAGLPDVTLSGQDFVFSKFLLCYAERIRAALGVGK